MGGCPVGYDAQMHSVGRTEAAKEELRNGINHPQLEGVFRVREPQFFTKSHAGQRAYVCFPCALYACPASGWV
jgi:hypothetical protein